jgi:uncharacterized membrane-anchored protein
MKTLRVVIFVVVALLQLSVPASVVWKREKTLQHGRVWKFKTEPVDPVDAIRGRYVALRLEAEKGRPAERPREDFTAGGVVYVTLKEDAEGFAQVEQISANPLHGDNVVKAEAGYWRDGWERVSFPFNRLWLMEKIAPEAERAYRENNRRDKQNAYVTVRVRDGDAALEQLFIDNQPLREYLRAHAPPKK